MNINDLKNVINNNYCLKVNDIYLISNYGLKTYKYLSSDYNYKYVIFVVDKDCLDYYSYRFDCYKKYNKILKKNLIFNKNKNFFSFYNNYIIYIFRTVENDIFNVCFENIFLKMNFVYSIKKNNYIINLKERWTNKLDFLYYYISDNKFSSDNLFISYFCLALGELAIIFLNKSYSEGSYINLFSCLYYFCDDVSLYDFDDPCNCCIDSLYRNLSFYVKRLIYKDQYDDAYKLIYKYVKNDDFNLFYSYIIFPFDFFNCLDMNNINVYSFNEIFMRFKKMERFLEILKKRNIN